MARRVIKAREHQIITKGKQEYRNEVRRRICDMQDQCAASKGVTVYDNIERKDTGV